jgi:hypothetical protein
MSGEKEKTISTGARVAAVKGEPAVGRLAVFVRRKW